MKPSIELVSTGSELLSGRTLNRHAQVLGAHLAPLGVVLLRDTTLPDDLEAIAAAVRDGLERVDIVITTGGLGATSDDITRDAVAAVVGREVEVDPGSLESMRRKYAARGRKVTEAAKRQTRIVGGAVPLENRAGIAPGQLVEAGGKVVFLLPGPPREFMAVLEDHVLPWLRERFGDVAVPDERLFLTTGLGESDIVTRLEAASFPPAGIDVAYCAGPGRVEIRLVRRGEDAGAMQRAEEAIRRILGRNVFAEERVELQDVVGRMFVERRATLAVAESCTGGLLSHRITSVSGSSAYFLGGVVTYSNEAKIRELQVEARVLEEQGAVSQEVAVQMAHGVRHRFGSDYGVGITGIAGPTGGTPEKPVGLVYISATNGPQTETVEHRFLGNRGQVVEWSTVTALDMLRRLVLEGP